MVAGFDINGYISGLTSRLQETHERRRPIMSEKRRGSLFRLGMAAVLAAGLVPAAAFADPEADFTETPPHRVF